MRFVNEPMKTQLLAFAALLAVTAARADVVTDWNAAALNAIRGYRTAPPIVSRNLAILHIAIYDAVNGINRTHEAYLVASSVPAGTSREAAASAAAHKVLTTLFPTNAPMFNTLHASTMARIRNGPQKNKGLEWGAMVAGRVLAARANDGSGNVVAAPSGSGPGIWVPTPPAFAPYLLAHWGTVSPFCMTDTAQFRPPGPPALDSEQYTADYNEVKAYGAAVGSMRTEDQTQIALFWADGPGTETPPGHWNHIAQDVARAMRNSMEENARLFALLNMAMADAAICAWDAKYFFHNWRPVTAVRSADLDSNPLTEPDPAWSSLIGTPPFPDYVSGHSTFSAAGATVLALFYGTDNIPFTTGSDFLPGVMRSFSGFSQAAEEAAMSRVYGGIHFRFASDDGLAGGLKIGEWTMANFLQPKGNHARK